MPNPYFPFHSLGYQCNPFRAVTDDEWVSLAIVPESVERVLGEPNFQILGDKGYGKTTTLLSLTARFKAQGLRTAYEHLEVEQNQFTTQLGNLDVFLLDEAQRLIGRERERLMENRLRLVIASHEDLTPLFNRFGLPLATVRFETVPLAHVAAVVERRLAFFALPDGPRRVTLQPEAIQLLHATFGADVRKIELALYEAFEAIKSRADLTTIEAEDVKRFLE
jgi:chromosomal replication initiation ATPase DnaA